MMPWADVAPGPWDVAPGPGPMVWIAGGFLMAAAVLAIIWIRRPKPPRSDELG